MTVDRQHTEADPARILVFSQRNIFEHAVWRCAFHEFEQLLEDIDSVDVVAPPTSAWYKNGKRLALRLGEHFRRPFNPGVKSVRVDKYYELFFVVCQKASELLNVHAVKGWKDHCRTSVCLITEYYVNEIATTKSCLETLAQFDHVLFMFSANGPFQKVIGGKGSYMAAGIDALRFCPYPDPPTRSIDVLSIGRRSPTTHQALVRMAREGRIFYAYDTIDDLKAYDLDEHRLLMASMAKRSKYFIVNPGKIDRPEETGGQSEFGYRYFEGAAPGAILIGERPRNKEFDRIFHWKDAVVDLPFGSEQIGEVMEELNRDPERQSRIRRNNMVESLLHHDWVYRWEEILRSVGLAALPSMMRRKEKLQQVAAMVESELLDSNEIEQVMKR